MNSEHKQSLSFDETIIKRTEDPTLDVEITEQDLAALEAKLIELGLRNEYNGYDDPVGSIEDTTGADGSD